MKQLRITESVVPVVLLVMLGAPPLAVAEESVKAKLRGFSESPANSTEATGEFRARISEDGTAIEYVLSYENLRATATQAHIHFAQRNVNGGIVAFLCSNLTPRPVDQPAGTPPYPARSGTVGGTIVAVDIIGRAASQGIAAGEIERVIDAIRKGVAYANVHSTMFPAGEIRGQIKRDSDD